MQTVIVSMAIRVEPRKYTSLVLFFGARDFYFDQLTTGKGDYNIE